MGQVGWLVKRRMQFHIFFFSHIKYSQTHSLLADSTKTLMYKKGV